MEDEDFDFLFDDPNFELDDTLDHVDDERDDCAADLSDDEDVERHEPIHLTNVRFAKAKLAGINIFDKVRKVLSCMKEEGLPLPLFLDALSWGDADCIKDRTCSYARTSLMVSDELPGILERWHMPPRTSSGAKPAGARQPLEEFALKVVCNRIDRGIKLSAPIFLSPPEELNEEHLTSFDFDSFKVEVKTYNPFLWEILRHAAYSPLQESRNKHKDPDMVVLNIVSQIQYTRSHRRGRVPKLWAVYLKACGLSARAFDALHALGLVMSHKWTANSFGVLSDRAMAEVRRLVHESPWNINHDNVDFPLRVFSQRLHNQTHFISGCAATVWILPERAALSLQANRLFQIHRALNCDKMFDYADVLYGNATVDARMEEQDSYFVLRLILDSPDFKDYPGHGAAAFNPPLPVHKLPTGPEEAVTGFILHTVPYEEASYEGTIRCMLEWFRQLLLNTEDEQKRTALQRIIAWLGDQLTVDRLRGLWKYRHEDYNSYDRMDWMIPVFGWFHLVMALANSLHKQYLSTSANVGSLRQAFDVLKWKGLISQATKGPFWHNLDEAINHISEAHFRACWLVTANVESLADLKTQTPTQLRDMSRKIIREHASREALVHLDRLPEAQRDHTKRQWTMWNADVLPYLQLRNAIKVGDIGRMQDLLPTLLFRFAGGGNPKYAGEILELLQGLNREWTPEIKSYITEFCWVMSRTGAENTCLPFDLGQEENIADIKVNYRSMGPGATMDYINKISPAIPTLRKVQRHMEKQFKTVARGAHHGTPDKEADVAMLTEHYVKSKLHIHCNGREVTQKSADVINLGAENLERLDTMENWFRLRSHKRSTLEDWDAGPANDALPIEPLLS
ncbi:hypothetical protein B0H16DRAFT_1435173 [Mycena metata]|uniref:DUF6589 domain-containing protein n=1 Tax=Mycena metata TaxID=1033252 RepID=A0AAD7MGF8_9AGAR|nr:hypothetical protein B0H16DRAFT_1435173 [Mycena metata]